jgi:glyoxylase-like metal-dependent hydrolase (beta-lactamase superfamily II)
MDMRFNIGDATMDVVVDLDRFALPTARFMPDVDFAALEVHRDWLEPDHADFGAGQLLIAMQALLLRIPGLTVLIDTCVGEDKPRPAHPSWNQRQESGFLERLAALGVGVEDVDVVFCTHLHADHVGWNTRLLDGRWVPTFPRARYLVGRQELAYWQERFAADPHLGHGSFADSVLPLLEAGRIVTVEDGEELAPGITLEPLPGHSPGQMGLRIRRGGEQAIVVGDAIHSPVQILRPEWTSALCTDPAQARATRRRLLECAVEEDLMLVAGHFRHCGCTRIRQKGDGFLPLLQKG